MIHVFTKPADISTKTISETNYIVITQEDVFGRIQTTYINESLWPEIGEHIEVETCAKQPLPESRSALGFHS